MATFQIRIMALAIDIIDKRGPSNETHRQLQLKKTKVKLYILAIHIATRHYSRLSLLTRQSASVLKMGESYESKIAKCISSYGQRNEAVLSVYIHLSHPSLLTKRSALVLKVGVLLWWQSI